MKTIVAILMFSGLQLTGLDMEHCPMHKEHMNEPSQHEANVKKHGDEAMGFRMTRQLTIFGCPRAAELLK